MSLHPLPVDLQLADVLAAVKNFQNDPGEGAHAMWHAIGFGIGLFHKHLSELRAAVAAKPELAAVLADIEASAPSLAATEVGAINWDTLKPWVKQLLAFLVMILD